MNLKSADIATAPAGYRVREWTSDVKISRSGFYALPPEIRPRSVTIGRRRIITEAPADWLARVGENDEAA